MMAQGQIQPQATETETGLDGKAPSGKTQRSPSFKGRTETALDLAQAKGCTRLLVKTADGSSFQFDFTAVAAEPASEPNDFDVLPPRSKRGH